MYKSVKRPVIAIDLDETLAPFLTHLNDFHNSEFTTNHKIENYENYIFHEIWGDDAKSEENKLSLFFKSTEFARRILPFKNSFESLSRLKLDFEIHAITTRDKNYENLTRDWIHLYFPNIFHNIHFVDNSWVKKVDICKHINAIILIDDDINCINGCISNGISTILFGDYSWNNSIHLSKFDSSCIEQIVTISDWNKILPEIYRICQLKSIDIISNQLKMAAIQMCSINDKEVNLHKTLRLIELAYTNGARFICLPECR